MWARGQNERWAEMEDELEGEKIGLLLTLHNPPALGRVCGSAAVFFGDFSAVRWSAGASGGYRVSSVYSGNMSRDVKSQDVSFRGTIDPTVSVGGKPGRSDHISPPLKGAICQDLFCIIHYVTAKNLLTLTVRTFFHHNIKTFGFKQYAINCWSAEHFMASSCRFSA